MVYTVNCLNLQGFHVASPFAIEIANISIGNLEAGANLLLLEIKSLGVQLNTGFTFMGKSIALPCPRQFK